ncbi:MAG: hypothetical protein HY646_17580, partial [Acidobacteria bacterium]|nr:hypothetical protein [Acidobacteriota bacterium]
MRFVRILLFSIFIANTSAAEAFETSSVRLRATFRLPSADGYARITRVAGGVHIQAEFSDMKPASLFGGDYNTYVFWGITDRGVSVNLGE